MRFASIPSEAPAASLFVLCRSSEVAIGRELAAIHWNIIRIRRDIRLHARLMQAKIDANEECSAEAQVLMRAEADLRLHIERRGAAGEALACDARA